MLDDRITEFLESVYKEPSVSNSLDLIFDFVGDLTVWEKAFNDSMALYGGPRIIEEPDCAVPNFDAIARMFELIDVTKLNSTEMTGFLCTTLAYKHNFPERVAFIEKMKNQLQTEGRDNDSIDSLLKGLI